MLTETDTLNI